MTSQGAATQLSVVIPTYRRMERLAALLDDIRRQQHLPAEVVVIDNDAAGSARDVIAAAGAQAPYPIHYEIQPHKNISLTRNRTFERASGAWLAVIDDDERAPPEWLLRLTEAAAHHQADVVLGPALPVVPSEAPDWIRRGHFYDFPRMPTGTVVPPNRLRFGNVLVSRAAFEKLPYLFDPELGLTGGEDGDLLARMALQGARIVWCDEAPVYEPVEARRLTLRWILLRALRGGQDFARHTLKGRYGNINWARRAALLLRSALQLLLAALLVPLSLPFGRHRAAAWLVKVWANAGKLSMMIGHHYHEYA